VVNGVVYIGSDDNNVYALNATTGALLWSYETNGEVESSPVVANGVVYVGSDDGNVYALNATTGALVWSYTTAGVVYSSPAVANGLVYVGWYASSGGVIALNANNGALVWSYPTGAVYSSPAVGNGAARPARITGIYEPAESLCLFMDAKGNLYGTTAVGGDLNCNRG